MENIFSLIGGATLVLLSGIQLIATIIIRQTLPNGDVFIQCLGCGCGIIFGTVVMWPDKKKPSIEDEVNKMADSEYLHQIQTSKE